MLFIFEFTSSTLKCCPNTVYLIWIQGRGTYASIKLEMSDIPPTPAPGPPTALDIIPDMLSTHRQWVSVCWTPSKTNIYWERNSQLLHLLVLHHARRLRTTTTNAAPARGVSRKCLKTAQKLLPCWWRPGCWSNWPCRTPVQPLSAAHIYRNVMLKVEGGRQNNGLELTGLDASLCFCSAIFRLDL